MVARYIVLVKNKKRIMPDLSGKAIMPDGFVFWLVPAVNQ
jgi:hypothetical protein